MLNVTTGIQPSPLYTPQEFKLTVVPLWDTAAKVIGLPLIPFSYLYSVYQKVAQNSAAIAKKIPPCAPGHFLLGSVPELASMKWDILNFLVAYHHEYGLAEGICKVNLGTRIYYIISDPAKAKEILTRPKSFIRGESLNIWREKFSKGGLSEGDEAQRHRGQANQLIGQESVSHHFHGIQEVALEWLQTLAAVGSEGAVDIMFETERATLAAMGKSLFSLKNGANPFSLAPENEEIVTRFLHAYADLFEMLTNRIASPTANLPYVGDKLYATLYAAEETKLTDAQDTLKKILIPIFQEILTHKDENAESTQMQIFLEHFNLDPENPDYDELVAKSVGFLQAAFETTSKALGWTLTLLARHPEYQDTLRSQLCDKFEDKMPASLEELKSIPLLSQVMEESLRLFPPIPLLLRDIVEPDDFAEYTVEKNATFIISPLLTHRNPANWEDPDLFIPERFTEEMLTDSWQMRNMRYLTFLGGIHRCPGRFFGKQEILLFLAHFLMHYKITLDKEAEENFDLKLCITLRPKNPLAVSIEKV